MRRLVERLTAAEEQRLATVESVLPAIRERAREADAKAELLLENVRVIRDAGLLGLVVPSAYGGMDGTLRDLAGATFALATACPSTALAFFFHCSTASRGLLALEAIEAGLLDERARGFAERLLYRMGRDRQWLANFASESVKSEGSAITITTEARRDADGWVIDGTKSFGCSTGVADEYLVTAKMGADIALFFVKRDAAGVRERQRWDAVGMRGTATHGIVLEGARATDALTLPGAFHAMMKMSRGSFVGNQLAATAVYLGAAASVYDHAVELVRKARFADSGRSLGESPHLQAIVADMTVDLETAFLWLRRQLELETSDPPLLPKEDVVRQWRLCKGEVCEAAFRVGTGALKLSGTQGTTNQGPIARALRDLAVGLVQAFPAERGRLEAAKMILADREQPSFGVG
jgi:alkylation response protein AidB-like acyl-CoA dehydrogenase